ncbi:Disease resistance protein L6 [Linum grandiflorum]
MIRGAERLTRLDGLGNLMSCSDCNLASLIIQGCPVLYTTWTYVDDDEVEFTQIGCFDEDEEEKLVKIESLHEMFIDSCPMLDGWAIPDLTKFPKLKKLHIQGISHHESSKSLLLEGLEDMEELVHLQLGGFDTVERLPSISKLSKLKHLALWEIPCLLEIAGLGDLKSLKVLTISGCTSLERLDLSAYKSMDDIQLDLRGCTNFATSDLAPLMGSRFEATIKWPHEPL